MRNAHIRRTVMWMFSTQARPLMLRKIYSDTITISKMGLIQVMHWFTLFSSKIYRVGSLARRVNQGFFFQWFRRSYIVTKWGFGKGGSGANKNIFTIALLGQSALFAVSLFAVALFAVSCRGPFIIRSRTSWRDRPDARQLNPAILTLGTSWRQKI